MAAAPAYMEPDNETLELQFEAPNTENRPASGGESAEIAESHAVPQNRGDEAVSSGEVTS
eukprot:2267433-Rhodomonas_salina.1